MKSENVKQTKNKKPPKKLKSVNFTMWGYFCILAVFLIFALELVFYSVVAGTFGNQARQRVERIGKEVCMEIRAGFPVNDLSLRRYASDGVYVYILDSRGNVLSPQTPAAEVDEKVVTELLNYLGGYGAGSEIIFRAGEGINYGAKLGAGRNEHYVLATYSLSIVKETVGTLQLYLFIVGVVILALSFLISYLISQKITRGLKSMSSAAAELAKGDYTVKFTNVDYKEMAQLSDTLNHVRDEVKKSEDFQREILANVTHDLKTPLTMIKAYASMIREISGDNKEKREKHLKVIEDEADRLTGLVNDVLSVSKLQSNLDVINPKVFNLTELVYGIINKFGYLQETNGYSFMLDIDKDLYTRADEEKIKQVIYNLLGNAANYTGEDKTVYISLKQSMDGQRIKFCVRDTGKGIEEKDLNEIWNRYYRVKENHNRPVKGTGLGLNIVKVILTNHAFDFGVESKINQGSAFWVDFPSVPSAIDITKE
ncbi:MAG: HAMP domain-containing histidine kinase [Clostridia bacterium]|nr:HAMP domain-containing histidine kinase [Clostridia bacterium]